MENQAVVMFFIFMARVMDVSIRTVRIILIARGFKNIAPFLGFFEVMIWLYAVSKALENVNSIYSYIIYAVGFAAGNYIGMWLEEKIAIGFVSVRIITSKEITALPMQLREEGFDASIVEGRSDKGEIFIIYTVIPRREVKKVLELIKVLEPAGLITLEDVKPLNGGYIGKKSILNVFNRQMR